MNENVGELSGRYQIPYELKRLSDHYDELRVYIIKLEAQLAAANAKVEELESEIKAAEYPLDKCFETPPEVNLATKASDVREMLNKAYDSIERLNRPFTGEEIREILAEAGISAKTTGMAPMITVLVTEALNALRGLGGSK